MGFPGQNQSGVAISSLRVTGIRLVISLRQTVLPLCHLKNPEIGLPSGGYQRPTKKKMKLVGGKQSPVCYSRSAVLRVLSSGS